MGLFDKSPEQERIDRGRERLQSIAPHRDVAWEWYRGNHYADVDERNKVRYQETVTTVRGTGKPRWVARKKRNYIFDVVLRKASAASSRVPDYQINPSTTDPEDVGAARLSIKVAHYGYHAWGLREATRNATMHAVVAGESFAWVYFDNTIGPFIGDEKGDVGLGDVRVRIFGANDCYWEPGLRFEESPWHVVELAIPVSEVLNWPGYIGPKKLSADARARALSSRGKGQSDKAKLVLVSQYLERPSTKHPAGRWLTKANGKDILDPNRPYPRQGDSKPCLHKLSYAPDPDSDRDLGLVPQIIDPQATKNDCENKITEWKNKLLHPSIAATPGLFKKQRYTGEPGKVYEIPQPEQNLKVIETAPIPPELSQQGDRAVADMDRIAALGPQDASQFESGKEAQVYASAAADREAMFIADLASWHANVMHDCLAEVQRGYAEPRLLQIRGRFGPEPLDGFKGAKLRGQTDVVVSPDSIEPRTKASVEQKLQNVAAMFPGVFPPEEILSAMESGTAGALLESYELAKARAHGVIQKIKDGTFAEAPMRPVLSNEEHMVPVYDDETGEIIVNPDGSTVMELATEVPEWIPRPFDPIAIHKKEFEDWMQTMDWDFLPPEGKEGAHLYYQTLLDLEAKEAQRAAVMQQEMAQGLGLSNAAKPQGPPPMPSQPAIEQQPT